MKKFIPNLEAIVKGVIITAISLVALKFAPAKVKAFIMG